jgi:hypothetical protein
MEVIAGKANGNLLLTGRNVERLCSKVEAMQIGMGDVSIYAAEGRVEESSHIQGVSSKTLAPRTRKTGCL